MAYSVRDFGTTSDGKKVSLYTLTNSKGTEASFTDLGAAWVTMKVKDSAGNTDDVVLGFDTGIEYENNKTNFGECVGRNANRIGGAKFTIDGKEYHIAANDHEVNNLHSGPDYWRTRLFTAKTEESKLGSKVTFTLDSPDMDQGYPGHMTFSCAYILQEDDSLMLEYTAVSDKDTICNPTNHSYFNLAGHKAGSILDQEVWINADHYTPADASSIPTGEIAPVAGTVMDFTEMKPIGRDIDSDFDQIVKGHGFDHNWVLNGYDGTAIRLVAKARDNKTGRTMKVYTDLPGMQFYTGNFLQGGLNGKEGTDYPRRSGYCFETQFYPDSINKPAWPQPVLKAGETFHHFTVYKFSAKTEARDEEK